MANEIAKKESNEMAEYKASLEDLASELEGLGAVSFDSVKVPSGGGLAWEIPGDDPDNPDTAKEIEGIIVYRQNTNAYFSTPFTGANEHPDCSSRDGKTGYDADGHPCSCADCPRNKFVDGHKACANKVALYVLQEGALLPIKVIVPPSSIKPLTEYVKRLVVRGKKLAWVRTGLSLSKEKSGGGITYSRIKFEKKADLTAEEIKAAASMGAFVKSVIDAGGGEADSGDFVEVTGEDNELPF